MRVVLAGGEAAGQRVLRALATAGHDVVAVFAGDGSMGGPVRAEAARLGVAVHPARRVQDPSVIGTIGAIDLMLNVHSLYLVAPELLDWPALGAYNVHPGWLPEFAGRNCPSWAVWTGEPEPGVTIHRMDPEIDRGALALQERFRAGPTATGGSVAVECARRGVALVGRLVESLVDGSLELREQDASRFRYFGRDVPLGGRACFERPAFELDRLVRACDYGPFVSPWGVVRAAAGASPVGLRRVAPTERACDAPPGTLRHAAGRVFVACSDYWIELISVTVDGGATGDAPRALAGVARLTTPDT
jgi:methionyl-tRNA formyltransferase